MVGFFSCMFLFFLPASLSAGASEGLSWGECSEFAQMNNPDIVSAREKILSAEASWKISRSALLPQINASASGTKKYSTDTSSSYNSYSYGIEAKQLIFDGFKSWYDYKSSASMESAARYDYIASSAQVRCNLRTAFVNLLKAQELVPIARDIESRRKHILEVVKMHYETGTEHRGSYFAAQADYEEAKADTASAIRNLSLMQRNLSSLMGRDVALPIAVKGNLALEESYSAQPDFAPLALNNPSVKSAALARESAGYDALSARRDFSPKIYGSAGATKSGDRVYPDENNYYIGFSASAPIFSGGETYYSMKKAEAAKRRSAADERSVRDEVFRSLDSSWNDLQDAISAVAVQSQYLRAASERSKIGEVQYSMGSLTFNNWTILESNLVSAKKSYLEACAAVLRAEALWILSTGGALENETQK